MTDTFYGVKIYINKLVFKVSVLVLNCCENPPFLFLDYSFKNEALLSFILLYLHPKCTENSPMTELTSSQKPHGP